MAKTTVKSRLGLFVCLFVAPAAAAASMVVGHWGDGGCGGGNWSRSRWYE